MIKGLLLFGSICIYATSMSQTKKIDSASFMNIYNEIQLRAEDRVENPMYEELYPHGWKTLYVKTSKKSTAKIKSKETLEDPIKAVADKLNQINKLD